MEHELQNRPHVFAERGNVLFVHVPKSFTDEEIENWANKEKPLGDVFWKVLKKHPDPNTDVRIDCPGRDDSAHVTLTPDGRPPVISDKEKEEDEEEQFARMHQQVKTLSTILRFSARGTKRPKLPHINVTGTGLYSLTEFKPEFGDKLKAMLQQVMRGPSQITVLQREILASQISIQNWSIWCARVHRNIGVEMAGGKDRFLEQALTPQMQALGSFVVSVNEGIPMPVDYADKVKAEGGWSDEALHDAVTLVGIITMVNRYVEGLAAVTPPGNDPSYKQIVDKIIKDGYL